MSDAKSAHLPQVFISYSYDSERHKEWVRLLASELKRNGICVILDQWHLRPGESITQFMESAVRDTDFVLVVCTPAYAKKSNARQGGVGYEQQIVSGQLLYGTPRFKFVPLLRSGEFEDGPNCAIPTHFAGSLAIDFRKISALKIPESKGFAELIRTIRAHPPSRKNVFPTPPPTGPPEDEVRTALKLYAQSIMNLRRVRDLDRFRLKLSAKCGSQQSPLSDLIREHPRLVITGAPGSGKTIFMLRMLRSRCLTLLEELSRAEASSDPVEVPIYIELGLLTQVDVPSSATQRTLNGLLSLVIEQVFPLSQEDPLSTLLTLLSGRKIILFLDGLNELPNDHQDKCARDLFALEQRLSRLGKQERLQIVLTSRVYGFKDVFKKEGWELVEILPLAPQAIEEELSKGVARAPALVGDLFRRIDPKFRQLLSNPQHLDYVIEWCQDKLETGISIEESLRSKGALLRYCIEKKLNKLTGSKLPLVEAILSQLAYDNATAGTFFAYSDMMNTATRTLQSFNSKLDAELLLEEVIDSGILIRSREPSSTILAPLEKGAPRRPTTGYSCRFVHHSVQQYFAACAMKHHWALDEYLGAELWHEPLVILAGIVNRERLDELLSAVQPNTRLYAYVLANIHEPVLEAEFLTETVKVFIKRTHTWATRLARTITFIASLWFLSVPLMAYLLVASQAAAPRPSVQILLIFLGLCYFFLSPVILIRWHKKRFRHMKERLSDAELPNLIVILKFLLARGAMMLVRTELRALRDTMKCGDEDPRKAFVDEAIRIVSQAADSPSYMTEDEILEQLDNPLIAASVDPESLSARGLDSLYVKAKSPTDDASGRKAMDLLKELYVRNYECREQVAKIFLTIALNLDGTYSPGRRRHAIQICHRLGIAMPREPGRLWQILSGFFSLFKRLWHAQ